MSSLSRSQKQAALGLQVVKPNSSEWKAILDEPEAVFEIFSFALEKNAALEFPLNFDSLSEAMLTLYRRVPEGFETQKDNIFHILEVLAGAPEQANAARQGIMALAEQNDRRAVEKTERIIQRFHSRSNPEHAKPPAMDTASLKADNIRRTREILLSFGLE
ncbi:MAG: hypothetical protein LRZ85_02550 [Alphaproteobacteria bacterium]|nr:hypothetical protein [Alphaproteobacteria bacterium]